MVATISTRYPWRTVSKNLETRTYSTWCHIFHPFASWCHIFHRKPGTRSELLTVLENWYDIDRPDDTALWICQASNSAGRIVDFEPQTDNMRPARTDRLCVVKVVMFSQ